MKIFNAVALVIALPNGKLAHAACGNCEWTDAWGCPSRDGKPCRAWAMKVPAGGQSEVLCGTEEAPQRKAA